MLPSLPRPATQVLPLLPQVPLAQCLGTLDRAHNPTVRSEQAAP